MINIFGHNVNIDEHDSLIAFMSAGMSYDMAVSVERILYYTYDIVYRIDNERFSLEHGENRSVVDKMNTKGYEWSLWNVLQGESFSYNQKVFTVDDIKADPLSYVNYNGGLGSLIREYAKCLI